MLKKAFCCWESQLVSRPSQYGCQFATLDFCEWNRRTNRRKQWPETRYSSLTLAKSQILLPTITLLRWARRCPLYVSNGWCFWSFTLHRPCSQNLTLRSSFRSLRERGTLIASILKRGTVPRARFTCPRAHICQKLLQQSNNCFYRKWHGLCSLSNMTI